MEWEGTMTDLAPDARAELARITGDMMTLLSLDDAWTEWTELSGQQSATFYTSHSPLGITGQMLELLPRMEEAAYFIGSLPDRMGDDLQARFDALMWGEGLSTGERDDLRWLVTRAGGFAGLAQSTAATLSNWGIEQNALQEQVQRFQTGQPLIGDLTREFRCGLGSGLLISGAASLPSAVGTAAGAALAAGGTIAAGVLVGSTFGVGAIALVVAGILVMRRQKC
jgi:hypothetical protein